MIKKKEKTVKMKKIGKYLAVAFLFFYCTFLSAAELTGKVEATVDRDKMGIGDAFTLTIVVQANDDFDEAEIKLPKLNGIEFLNTWTDGKSSSTRMSIVNGKSDFSKTVQMAYHFMLSPQKEGQLIIPVIDVPIQGKTYKTQPIRIDVSEKYRGQQPEAKKRGGRQLPPGFEDPFGDDENDIFAQLLKEKEKIFNQMQRGGSGGIPNGFGGPSQPIEKRQLDINTNEAFFIYLDVDKKEVYEGQQITANWYIYVKGQIESLDRAKFPDLKGFWKEIIEEVPGLQFYPEIVNGVTYQKALLASHALFPIKAGTSVIDEFKVKAKTRMPTQFGWGEAREWTKVSKRTSIKVLPLPLDDKPRNFSGAVGSFQVDVKTDGNQFPAHQPLSVKIRFEGSGNAKLIELPAIQWPEGLEVFDTKSEAKFFKNGQSYKEFEVLVIPRQEGEVKIPGLSVSMFDPQTQKYYTKTTEPITLNVVNNPNAPVGSSTRMADTGKAKATLPENRLPDPVMNWEPAKDASLLYRPWVWGLIYGLISLSFLFKAQREFGWGRRRRTLKELAQKRYKKVEAALAKNDYRKVGVEMTNTYYMVLGEIAGTGGASQEISRLVDLMPPSLRRDYGDDIAKSFETFQTLSFAPEEVLGKLKEPAQLKASVEQGKKVISAIIAAVETK